MKPTGIPTQPLAAWWPRLLISWREAAGLPASTASRLSPSEERLVVRGMQKLSLGLTRERHLAGEDYFQAPDLLGAYLLYFWPVSYLQALHALRYLPAPPRTLLELGAGAGPLGAAAFDLGAQHVTFADRSRRILKLADRLARLAGLPHALITWDPSSPGAHFSGLFDAIGLQHVLNELWPQSQDRIARRTALLTALRPLLSRNGCLLVMEPALTATSRDLSQVRNQALAAGFGLRGPCLTSAPCPALIPAGDSCHLEWDWQPPLPLKRLITLAKFKKEAIKASLMVFQAGPASKPLAAAEDFLIVSERMRSKNQRWRFMACGPAGRVSLALHPRNSSDTNAVFQTLRRGDRVRVIGACTRPGGLDLLPDTRVERIS
jgi:hypothetical protein